ncbi:MAG: enoyl-CoA hydratase/isomerase family protein, partial [Janthinobacterium lividum]
MPPETTIEVNVDAGIAILALGRAPVNAMDDAFVAEFHHILDGLAARRDWSVLHLRSTLKAFSAGADLKQLRENFTLDPAVQAEVGTRYQALFRRIEALDAVTLAEIGGAALGGGLELALACDLRVTADEARLGLPEVGLGLIPGAGGTQRLTLLCGRSQALRLILGATVINGQEAYRIGLVQWASPRADLAERARSIAQDYARL